MLSSESALQLYFWRNPSLGKIVNIEMSNLTEGFKFQDLANNDPGGFYCRLKFIVRIRVRVILQEDFKTTIELALHRNYESLQLLSRALSPGIHASFTLM